MGALDPGPWAELQVSGAIPTRGICPLRLPHSGSTFLLLLLTLPAPHAPSCSLRSGFPVTANNVLIHSVSGIWRRGEGLGAEEEEGERQRSECAWPGPAVQLWLKVLCGALWLSAAPVFMAMRAVHSCGLSICPAVVLSKPTDSSSRVYWELASCKHPAGQCVGTRLLLQGEWPEGCTALIRRQRSCMGSICPMNTVRLFTAPALV